ATGPSYDDAVLDRVPPARPGAAPVLRTPTPQDATAWAEFLARSQAVTYASLMPAAFAEQQRAGAATYAESLAEQFASDDGSIRRLAEVDGIVVGVASSGPAPQAWEESLGMVPAPADWQLGRLYLDADWHGTGLADRLLAEVLPDDRPVYLWIIDGNARAQRFYQRRGFQDLDERIPAGERWYSVPMHRMVRTAV